MDSDKIYTFQEDSVTGNIVLFDTLDVPELGEVVTAATSDPTGTYVVGAILFGVCLREEARSPEVVVTGFVREHQHNESDLAQRTAFRIDESPKLHEYRPFRCRR